MGRKIVAFVILVSVFAWTWANYNSDNLKNAKVIFLFLIGIVLLLGAFAMGCAVDDIILLATNPKYCPLIIPGYAFIVSGFAILVKRLWLWARSGK